MRQLRYIFSLISTIIGVILFFTIGTLVIVNFNEMPWRYIFGVIILLIIVGLLINHFHNYKIQKAREEYYDIQKKHPYDAQEHCPHKFFSLSQKDYGVLVATDKWCKICGKHLGPAKLKKSIFGNSWE